MKTLIITEKPKVSQRIARALSDKPLRKRHGRVSYFQFSENGNEVYVASAAGHLYSLKQEDEGYHYPVFDISWKPLYEIEKGKHYTKAYIDALKALSRDADTFIIATDWDMEGELLGYNALRFAGGGLEARRMRFSTLVSHDLRRAYENLSEVDMGLVEAGEARHIMDWYWGINVSRALMRSVRALGGRLTISAGRVQTPALSILVKREREISGFVPEKFYEIFAQINMDGSRVRAAHRKGRFSSREEAEERAQAAKGASALVTGVEIRDQKRLPPVPFDLGELQKEAFRVFRYTPKRAQAIAQSLYENGFISYPRTSSQKYPPGIGFRRVIEALSRIRGFEAASRLLEKEKLYPRQGQKDDPAHPAIYPTGIAPKGLSKEEEKLYALIVHRFLAAFGDPAELRHTTVDLSLNREPFYFEAAEVVARGWMDLYPYVKVDETHVPALQKGETLPVARVWLKEGETKPPSRYNPASLIRVLEEKGLGTKATRADIVDTLYRRGYIKNVSIRVTEGGMAVIEALERHVPEIVDEELTRRFEGYVEKIQAGEVTKEAVLEEARAELLKILREFQAKERDIGRELLRAFTESQRKESVLGGCPRCDGELRIVRSPRTGKSFVGCSNYPRCSVSYPLPQKVSSTPAGRSCEECGLPMVKLGFKGKKVLSCIDLKCPSKQKR
ncbi:MAG: DNA topoisomerase I [Methanobacteriota archaeon]|nr:MAG: DNA topoisomerase I [Euryarchaeota archaeon]